MARSSPILIILLLLMPFLLVGCGDSDSTAPEPDPGPPPPVFTATSLGATLQDGRPGVQFRAIASVNVSLVQVVLTPPGSPPINFSPQQQIMLGGQPFDLQDPGVGYYRWTGNWIIRFIGNQQPSQAPFDVTITVPVS